MAAPATAVRYTAGERAIYTSLVDAFGMEKLRVGPKPRKPARAPGLTHVDNARHQLPGCLLQLTPGKRALAQADCFLQLDQYFGGSAIALEGQMHSLAMWPTLIAVLIATISDLRTRRIPNWLVFPFLAAGIIVSAIHGGWADLSQSLLGILLAAVLMGVLYWLGGMGMGDVKLCAAIGAWIGPSQLFLALVVMGIAGGVMAITYAFFGGFMGESLDGAGELLSGFWRRGFRPHSRLVLSNATTRKLPYAPAIAIGTLFSFFSVTR